MAFVTKSAALVFGVVIAAGCDEGRPRKPNASTSSSPAPAIAVSIDDAAVARPPVVEADAAPDGLGRYTAGQWIVDRPAAGVGNPLASATLRGVANVEDRTQPSLLVIKCRADDGGAGLWAELGVHRELGFDVDPFEGPGGVGGSKRLLSIAWPGAASESHLVAGWWSAEWPDMFVFSGSMNRPGSKATLAARVLASAGREVVFTVRDAQGDGQPVKARFHLPVDAAALTDAIQACLR
jgi:hypothetical protein